MKSALPKVLFLCLCCCLTQQTIAQKDQLRQNYPKHGIGLNIGVLPTTFLSSKTQLSSERFWANEWREQYQLVQLAYERRLNKAYPLIRLRTEIGYYGFDITDFRAEDNQTVTFHDWSGGFLLFSPSIMASFQERSRLQPTFGFGLLLTLPVDDQLSLFYSDEDQADFGFPREETQEDGLATGFGFYLQAGGRFLLTDRWQLGLRFQGILLELRTGYSERTGSNYPVSRFFNKSIFTKTQLWGTLEVLYFLPTK